MSNIKVMSKKNKEKKEELLKFIEFFVDNNLKYSFSNETYEKYVDRFIECTSPRAVNRLNKLLNEFEEVLGTKFDEDRYCDRSWNFRNWVYRPEELKPHIKWLRQQRKEEEDKKLRRELKREEARLKRLEKEMKKLKKDLEY